MLSVWKFLEKQNSVCIFNISFPLDLIFSDSQVYLWISPYRLKFILRNLLGLYIRTQLYVILINFSLNYILNNVYIISESRRNSHFLGYISSPTVWSRPMLFYNILNVKPFTAINPRYYLVITASSIFTVLSLDA